MHQPTPRSLGFPHSSPEVRASSCLAAVLSYGCSLYTSTKDTVCLLVPCFTAYNPRKGKLEAETSRLSSRHQGKRKRIGCQITSSRRNEDIKVERAKRTKKLKIVLPHCITVARCDTLMSGRKPNLYLYILSPSY